MHSVAEKSYRIYISPANHHKPYVIGSYTEKQQMDKLAEYLVEELAAYEDAIPVHTTVYSPDQSYVGRPQEARDKRCDLYVALHSNAGGGKGACVFYHPALPLSKKTALEVVDELNRICPIKSNRAVQPAIYPWDSLYWNLGELREPAAYGIPPVLIEHEFHDTVEGASWIVSSLNEIAAADAFAIASSLGLKKKELKGDVNGNGRVDNIDAAQILRYDAGIIELSEEQKKQADYNGDGEVNNIDAVQILRDEVM